MNSSAKKIISLFFTYLIGSTSSRASAPSTAVCLDETPAVPCSPQAVSSLSSQALEERMWGSQSDKKTTARYILDLANSDETIKHYFEIAFNYLPDLTIILYPVEALGHLEDVPVAGRFLPIQQRLHLPQQIGKYQYKDALEILRHEIRHVVMAAMHSMFANKKSYHLECFFPLTTEKKNEMEEMLARGYAAVNQVMDWLKQEKIGQLLPDEKSQLMAIRQKIPAYYEALYTTDIFSVKLTSLALLQQLIGAPLVEGGVFSGDKLLGKPFGNYRIKTIDTRSQPDSMVITAVPTDLLYHLCAVIQQTQIKIKNNYSKNNQLFEADAYLHGNTPPIMIDFFFTDFYRTIAALLAQVKRMPMPQQPRRIPKYISITESNLLENCLEVALQNLHPHAFKFTPDQVENFLNWAKLAIEEGYYAEAKRSLIAFRDKGFYRAAVTALLAELTQQEQAKPPACGFFQPAPEPAASLPVALPSLTF